ncbi:hypothetical protein PHLCEN_2v1862, partial [Hermanssonia centrifuga]
ILSEKDGLAGIFHPETGTVLSASTVGSPLPSSLVSTASTTSSLFDDKKLGLMGMGNRTPEDRSRSLTDLKWGEFESMGFGAVGADEKKLQFDLTLWQIPGASGYAYVQYPRYVV